MKNLSLLISTLSLGLVVFFTLPSVIPTLTAQAAACTSLVSSTCGLNPATCQFEGGTVRSDYSCSNGICCAWPPIVENKPPPVTCESWGGYCIYSYYPVKPTCPSGTTAYPGYETAGGPGDCLPFTTGNPIYSACCRPNPTYTLSGYVYADNNGNGQRDSGEGISGVTVRRSTSSTTDTTDGNGFYSFGGLGGSTSHTVTITVPANYVAGNPNPPSRTVSMNNANRPNNNFIIIPIYSITGSVFNDCSRNYVKDTCPDRNGNEIPETKDWTAGISISRSPANGSVSVNQSSGTFSITGLFAGTYTVSLSSGIPTAEGYSNRHPVNGPPPQFSVTVGGGCGYSPLHPNTSGRATCNSRGDVSNLNFVVSNSNPWFQVIGLDARIDNGINNLIPADPLYPPYMSIIDNLD